MNVTVKEKNTTELRFKDFKMPKATSIESPFKYEELFFSVTDSKSVIKFANETFIRISKYDEDEMMGQLHKIVRHPDMPRCVFNIFWDYLKANKPISAYVKNMSKDGSYYWVLALAFPYGDDYISIRLKPGSELFEQVESLYAETLKYEKELEQEHDKKTAMEGAQAYLIGKLNDLGFDDYNHFMWVALQKEMKNREQILQKDSRKRKMSDSISKELLELESILSKLVFTIDTLINIHESLNTESEYILDLARTVLLLSMNAQVGSSKLDKSDQSLSVVAEQMGNQSKEGEKHLVGLKDDISNLNGLIGELNFDIISAKLQVEMNIYFKNEIDQLDSTSYQAIEVAKQASDVLKDCYVPRIDDICKGVESVNHYLNEIGHGVEHISRFLMVLRFIHITGKVEVARMSENATSFSNTFQELIKEINNAEIRLKKLKDVVVSNQTILKMNRRQIQSLVELKKTI
jgi:aerotaxis receptor